MTPHIRRPWGLVLLLVLHLVSHQVLAGTPGTLQQAVAWLPSGVAIAGLWLLGIGAWWVLPVSIVLQRVWLGYSAPHMIAPAIGNTLEAVVGVLVLRRLGFRATQERLRDCLAVFAAAVLAPVVSVLFAHADRLLLHPADFPTIVPGLIGWWRMNTLGILMVVPTALVWLAVPRRPLRLPRALEAGAIGVAIVALLVSVMTLVPPGITAIVLLYLSLPLSLYAGVRFGPRGASSAAALSALVVAVAAGYGIGPFHALPFAERDEAAQVFELSLVAVPLVLGALIAEREASVTLRLQSEGLHAAFQQVLPDITYRMDAAGTYLDLFVPPGITPPYSREQLIGKTVYDLAPPRLAAKMLARIQAALAGERPEPLEYRIDAVGGVRVREARYVRLSEGEVLGVVRDITDRKRAESPLGWQAEMLELIASSRPARETFASLVKGIEQFSTGGTCSILLLQGKILRVAAAPHLPDDYNAAIDGAEMGPSVGSCGTAAFDNRTVIVTDIATDPLWADFRDLALPHGLRACWSVPIRSPAGAVLGTFAIYYRTPRAPTPAEIALVERAAVLAGLAMDRERREDLLASINRNVNEGLYRSTPERGLVYVNQAFARIFGYENPEEVLKVASPMLYEDPERREHMKRLITEQGYFTNEEVRFRRRDGSVFWGLVSSTGVRGPDGTVQYYDGAVADITARKELEGQLRQSQKMEAVGKLAGGIAHDFNNLLTAISGYAEAIRDAAPDGGPIRADVDEVLKAADRAAGLTRQLLAYSRQQVLSPQVLDLTGVVEQLGGMLRRLIGEDYRLVTQHASGDCRVRVDRGQLEQVILNLVVNARDAMPRGGPVAISTAAVGVDTAFARGHVDLEPGQYVVLSVQDSGVGMDRDVQARAFDPFFTTKEQGKGTGLGLSTVYGIVKQSGGAIWLDSAPGAGTTVWIYLPRVAAEPEPEIPALPEVAGAAQATILVVEDEPLVRDLVRRTLTRAGHQVLAAIDGEAALLVARSHPGTIDLVVTDVVMPRMGGRELAQRLAAERPGIRLLFMSGYASETRDLADTVLTAGELLHKPFSPARLLERVALLLAPGRVGT